jgi:hypothetical protein
MRASALRRSGIGASAMLVQCRGSRDAFDELREGERIEIEHCVTVGAKTWTTKTIGKVVRTERRRHGLHYQRNFDDKVFSDVILLELPDGELTTITLDEFTAIRTID